jgi:hypothetical protein
LLNPDGCADVATPSTHAADGRLLPLKAPHNVVPGTSPVTPAGREGGGAAAANLLDTRQSADDFSTTSEFRKDLHEQENSQGFTEAQLSDMRVAGVGTHGEVCGQWFTQCCTECGIREKRGPDGKPVRSFRRYYGNTCRDRVLCLGCRARYARKQSRVFRPGIKALFRRDHVVLASFAIRDGPVLKDQRKKLKKAFVKIKQQGFWKDRVWGGVAAEENKLGARSGEWHPHIHAFLSPKKGKFLHLHDYVVFGGREIGIDRLDAPAGDLGGVAAVLLLRLLYAGAKVRQGLRTRWEKATGGSWTVDLRRVERGDEEKERKSIQELLKYPLKDNFEDLTPELRDEVAKELRNAKLVNVFGELHVRIKRLREAAKREAALKGEDKWACGLCGSTHTVSLTEQEAQARMLWQDQVQVKVAATAVVTAEPRVEWIQRKFGWG